MKSIKMRITAAIVICSYIRYNPDFTEPTSGIFLTRSDTKSAFSSVTPTDFSMYAKDDLAHVGWLVLYSGCQ